MARCIESRSAPAGNWSLKTRRLTGAWREGRAAPRRANAHVEGLTSSCTIDSVFPADATGPFRAERDRPGLASRIGPDQAPPRRRRASRAPSREQSLDPADMHAVGLADSRRAATAATCRVHFKPRAPCA